jgi:hypothetical protein
MTKVTILICSMLLLAIIGCQPTQQRPAYQADDQLNNCYDFAPTKIKIIGLTEFTDDSTLKVYVDLIDRFGSRIKRPAVFRFELYEHVERSAEPKGKRIFLWPNIDLTDAAVNNSYWRDFLHTYEFSMNIDFDIDVKQTYILQAHCRTSSGNRLTATKQLTFSEH